MINVYPTHNNWFKTIIPNDLSSFKIELDRYTNILMPFQDAVDFTVRLISKLDKKIFVSYSGGLDSEMVVDGFRRNNIEFTAFGGTNPYAPEEFEYAKHYCKKHKIKLLDFSISKKQSIQLATLLMRKKNVDIFPNYLAPVSAIMQLKLDNDSIVVDGGCHPLNTLLPYPFQIMQNEFFFEYLCKGNFIHFFNYTQELHDAIMNDINIELDTQEAKSVLYKLPYRPKLHGTYPMKKTDLQEYYDQIDLIISEREKYNPKNEHLIATYSKEMENRF